MIMFKRPVSRMLAVAVPLILAGCHSVEWSNEIRIVDADTQQPVPVRVHVRDRYGQQHIPPGAQVVPVGVYDRWFVSSGRVPFDVLNGRLEVRVEHGPEYRPIKKAIYVRAGEAFDATLELQRWINMRERGYVCGENHLHVPARELASQLAAEGLDFGTSLQWWNGPQYEVPPGDGFVRELEYAGVRVPSSIYDFEIEHAWGAVYVLGMPSALNAEGDRRRPNWPIVKPAHETGALVCYQGGWSREVLLDALLGYVDVVNVCNNNFHRHQFQPRTQYSNLLKAEGLPDYPNTPEGMMRMNTDTYYRLLNCGLRLAAGAGSATGPKKTPVGYNRAYVKAGPNPGLPDFLEAWRQGRNFVTCGPMLFLKVNDRYEPGDTIALAEPGEKIRISVEVISNLQLTSLEIVANGEVIGQLRDLPVPKVLDAGRQLYSAELTIERKMASGCWIAARCTDEDALLTDEELEANHSYGKEPMARRPCRLRFAHTSPIYISVAGKGARVDASIAEAHRMLDAFARFAKENASDDYRDRTLAAVEEARQKLEH